MLEVGSTLPAIRLADDTGAVVDTSDYAGSPLVLYFYPKDDTPGCTNEATQFRDDYATFIARDARVVGVSRDTPASHAKFKAKHAIPFALLADVDSALCETFGTIVEKMLYGKKRAVVRRSTFLFDASGTLVRVWPDVKVDGHASEVLAAL